MVAEQADIAIVFVGIDSSEGMDRTTLSLGEVNDNLVWEVLSVQPNTIVVINTPGAVLMPWKDSVPAILCAFLPGQEDGNAIAQVLFGDWSPSGKIPITFPVSDTQTPFGNNTLAYPGVDNEAFYIEDLLVGYRWYDAMSQEPLFPFGHGLSYTNFFYSDLSIRNQTNGDVSISFTVENNGEVFGVETPQLYLGLPDPVEPPKVLRGFTKAGLKPREQAQIGFTLTPAQDFSVWSVVTSDWEVLHGTFNAYIGSSSRDIRLFGTFDN